ncbi:MAG: AAA family ATPase [Acaryochloridaceae cyanobacterium RU_4_10]|nr:AAA family ATPase [Acaryochloridaceae cyanobacterium RU_4_10]
MNNTELLQAFQSASKNLFLTPLLSQSDVDAFGVEYGADVLDELEGWAEDCVNGSNKLIFTGHRGCGKSTLLAEFSRRLADRYFTVFFSISDLIEMSDVNHVNILFAIAVQMMEAAEEQNIKIKSSTKRAFYRWFGKHTQTETTTLEADLEAGYQAGGGFNIASIFKFFAELKAKLKVDATIRNEIKTEFVRQISGLIARIDEIAAVIQEASGKPILVIIDDLDKLDLELVESIYCNNIKPLFQPQFRIVYTIPIAANRELKVRNVISAETNDIKLMRVSKFFTKGTSHQSDPDVLEEPVRIFLEILRRRIPDVLIEPEIARNIVLCSGGVLREVIRLTHRCCSKCLVQIRRELRKEADQQAVLTLKIDESILSQALTDTQIEFAEPLGQVDYELLAGVYEQFKPQDAEDQRFLDLLHGLYILEYRNAALWYDLHPIVVMLLKQQELLS